MTDKSYLQDAEDDYMMTVTTICGPATVFTFNRVISNTDPDKDYPLSSPQPYSPQSHLFKDWSQLPSGDWTSGHPQQVLQVWGPSYFFENYRLNHFCQHHNALIQGSWGSGRDRVSDAGDIIIDVINIIVFFIFIIMVINFTPLSLLFRASTSKLNSIITKIKECSSQHTIRDNASLSTIWKQHQNHGSVHSQPLETCRSPSSASMTSGFDERSIDSIFDTPIK